jgi:hypothetical protein
VVSVLILRRRWNSAQTLLERSSDGCPVDGSLDRHPSRYRGGLVKLMLKPKYRLIRGFPSYRVGDDGSIESRKKGAWKKLRPGGHNDGYRHVTLRDHGKKLEATVHKLVLECFRGPRPKGKEARHLDGNPDHNRLENLVWATHQENIGDRHAQRTTARGSRHGRALLIESQVQEIYALREFSAKYVAELFAVSSGVVNAIWSGKSWKWLTGHTVP